MSAGRKTSERSLMIISRSVSRNSRTRFRFVFEENTSKSFEKTNAIQSAQTGDRRHEAELVRRRGRICTDVRTSMTLGWCSSRKYLTSRTADISRPSLNWPTLIFLMAILRPVASSRPGVCVCSPRQPGTRDENKKADLDTRLHTFPLRLFDPSPFWFMRAVITSMAGRGVRGEEETRTIFSVVLRWPSPLRPWSE